MTAILATGATGNVGGQVVQALLRRQLPVVAAARDLAALRGCFPEAAEPRRLDFLDQATWDTALHGIERLLLVRPPAIADVHNNLNPFIDRARARGVEHVVFVSVAGADRNRFIPHRRIEEHLRAHGDGFTNLRPGFFAQNLQTAYRQDIVDDDRIYVPAGRKPVNWIDVRDIAEVAALILEAPAAHRGQSYTLTGPGAVAWSHVIAALSAAAGRPIRYQPASVLGYARHLRRRGLPHGAIAVQTILHVLLRFGHGARLDPTLKRLLGRPATSVQQYVADHAQLWRTS